MSAGYSSGGGFSFYMGPSYWWGPSPFDIFYFSSSSPYGVNRYENPSQLSFLESVFSFLFGDGNPNANFEQRRYKALANLIRAKGGVVTAEEVAGYLDPPAEPDENKMIDESFVLPALTQLGGVPEVTESGDIVYVFEDLQLSAAAADDQGWEKLSLQELLQLAKSQGISTRGVYDKADLLAVIRAAQDTRSAKSNQEGARANTYLDEKPYQFSLATSGQVKQTRTADEPAEALEAIGSRCSCSSESLWGSIPRKVVCLALPRRARAHRSACPGVSLLEARGECRGRGGVVQGLERMRGSRRWQAGAESCAERQPQD
eukprot:748016-Hanusia_phi.AAC.1